MDAIRQAAERWGTARLVEKEETLFQRLVREGLAAPATGQREERCDERRPSTGLRSCGQS